MRCYATFVACAAALWHFADALAVSATSVSGGSPEEAAPVPRLGHHATALVHSTVRRKLRRRRHIAAASAEHAVDAAEGAASRRPIITGCLKECGYEEQTCVTQCQVCTEQNECRILGKCDSCMNAARASRSNAKTIDGGILDAGGAAMMRDGLMNEMTRARLAALDRLRELRSFREGVLKAQREAEWAAEERHASAKRLGEDRQVLKGARLEVTRWKLQNEKKLKVMRAKAREQRQERQKADRKLTAEKRRYSQAEQRLRIAASNHSESDGNVSASEEDEQDGGEDEVWRLAREVEERQQAVEKAERDVEKTSADGEWLDRGLRRRVKGAQKGARTSREELLEARARERVSRERLDDAKKRYVAAVTASQLAEKTAKDSEAKLREAPLSNAKTNATTVKLNDKESSLHSAASHLVGCSWLPLLVLLTVSSA